MGTRHLIMVIYKNEVQLAEYGQYDGYLSGVGTDIIKFLSTFDKEVFLSNLEKNNLKNNDNGNDDPKSAFHALELTQAGVKFNLVDSTEFGYNSLFCEYGYILNMDLDILEVYKGFNRGRLPVGERFYSEQSQDGGYFGIANYKNYRFEEIKLNTEAILAEFNFEE